MAWWIESSAYLVHPFNGALNYIPYQPRLIAELARGETTTRTLLRSVTVPPRTMVTGDGTAQHAGRRHSEYYLAFLAARESDLLGQDPHVAVSQIRRRLDDIRAAWRWAGDQGWLSGLEQGLEGLALFFDLTGLFDEAIQILDWTATRLQEFNEAMVSNTQVAGLLSRLLAWRAHFLNRSGQANEAIDLLFQALTFAQQSGEPREQAGVLSLLGEMLPHRGEFERAQQHQQDAISFYRSVADKRRLAVALTRLGVTHWRRGSYGDGMACFREALALQQGLQNRLGTARILWSMGGIAFEQRRYAEALSYAQEARDIYEAIGDRWGMATLAGNLALLSQAQGDFQTALVYNQQDLDYDLETGNRHGESVALGNRGGILLDAGRLDESMDCYQRALHIQEELGNGWEVARHRASIAGIWSRRHDPRQALVEYQRAIPVLRDHGARFYLIDPLLEAAHLLIDQGELAAARELAREGGRLAMELGMADWTLRSRILQVRLDFAAGASQDALAQLRRLAEQAEDPAQQASVYFWLWKLGQAETDRAAAEALYQELYRQIPRYEIRLRLQALVGATATE